MNHDQPQSESQNPEEDLFKWAQKTKKEEQEYDETDTCTLCKNGGFCPIHSVRPQQVSEKKKIEEDEVNDELQIVANSKNRIPDFQTNEEAAEYLKKLWEEGNSDENKKAS